MVECSDEFLRIENPFFRQYPNDHSEPEPELLILSVMRGYLLFERQSRESAFCFGKLFAEVCVLVDRENPGNQVDHDLMADGG